MNINFLLQKIYHFDVNISYKFLDRMQKMKNEKNKNIIYIFRRNSCVCPQTGVSLHRRKDKRQHR